MELRNYIRRIIYALALIWSASLYGYVTQTIPSSGAALSILMRFYAFTGLFLIFAALTPGLIKAYKPEFKYNPILGKAKRAFGVSSFYFICLHVSIAFFHNLAGSVSSFFYLSTNHQWALIFSSTAFLIIAAMAMTSFDAMVKLLGSRWKKLHRFVYVAAILILLHANMIGSHFTNPIAPLPLFINTLALIYIVLEVGATAKRLAVSDSTRPAWRNNLYYGSLALLIAVAGFVNFISFHKGVRDPHAAHRGHSNQPYTLQLSAEPSSVLPGEPIRLVMQVINQQTGEPLEGFKIHQEKYMHLIILSHDLTYFDHIHPEFDDKHTFSVTTQLPKEGTYHLYAQYYVPTIGEPVSTAVIRTVNAPKQEKVKISLSEPDQTIDQIKIKLSPISNIKAKQNITFRYALYDRASNTPITTIEPYLGAFGHLVIVSEDLTTYLHVHPLDLAASPEDRAGPELRFNTFFPKKGRYKLFAQLKYQNKLIVSEYVVEVK